MNSRSPSTLESSSDQDILIGQELRDVEQEEARGQPQMLAVARVLWPKRVMLLKSTTAGFVIAAIIALLIPRSYQTNVQLMPPDTASLNGSTGGALGMALGMGAPGLGGSSGSLPAGGLAGSIGDLLGSQKPGPLLIGILSSQTVSDRIIDRFDLRKVYGVKYYGAARKKLLTRVSFKEDKKSGLVSITVDDHDPVRATDMAKAYIEELNTVLSHVNNSASSREKQFLEERLASLKIDVQNSTKDLSDFSSKNATLDPEDQGKALLDAAAMLEGQLIAAKSELSGLEQIYTPENVRVRSLKAHISELEQQVNNLGGKDYAGSTKLDPGALYPSIRQLPVLDRQYSELYRRAKMNEIVFELLTEAYEMAKVQEAKDTPVVKVLDAPRLPERANWPPRTLFAFGGAFLGFFFASVAIVGAESWADDDPYRLFIAEVSASLTDDWVKLRSRLHGLLSKERDVSNRES